MTMLGSLKLSSNGKMVSGFIRILVGKLRREYRLGRGGRLCIARFGSTRRMRIGGWGSFDCLGIKIMGSRLFHFASRNSYLTSFLETNKCLL